MADENLPSGDYIAGFVDGEGCFALTFRRDVRHERKRKPVYYSWKVLFAIVLRKDDSELLKKIESVLGCGSISFTKSRENGEVRYQVSNIDDLKNKIVPFFKKHKLYGKKKYDFILWFEAVDILKKYKNKRGELNAIKGKRGFTKTIWDEKDLKRLLEIRNKMSVYKNIRFVPKWLHKAVMVGRGDK